MQCWILLGSSSGSKLWLMWNPLKSHLALDISLISKKPYETTGFAESFERIPQLILPELHLQLGHRWASRWCSGTVPLCKILGLWFQVITWLHPPLALHGWWPNRIAAILAPSSASRTGAFTLTCLKISQAQAINPKDAAEINMRAVYTHTHEQHAK